MRQAAYTIVKCDGTPVANGDYDALQHASNDLPLLRTVHKTSLYIKDNDRNAIVQPLPTER